jgi:hypothetical protein
MAKQNPRRKPYQQDIANTSDEQDASAGSSAAPSQIPGTPETHKAMGLLTTDLQKHLSSRQPTNSPASSADTPGLGGSGGDVGESETLIVGESDTLIVGESETLIGGASALGLTAGEGVEHGWAALRMQQRQRHSRLARFSAGRHKLEAAIKSAAKKRKTETRRPITSVDLKISLEERAERYESFKGIPFAIMMLLTYGQCCSQVSRRITFYCSW